MLAVVALVVVAVTITRTYNPPVTGFRQLGSDEPEGARLAHVERVGEQLEQTGSVQRGQSQATERRLELGQGLRGAVHEEVVARVVVEPEVGACADLVGVYVVAY